MELYREMLVRALERENICISFPQLQADPTQLVESACYIALQKIKAILCDNRLSDADCFAKIEEIVCALEEAGINCGSRHDFG